MIYQSFLLKWNLDFFIYCITWSLILIYNFRQKRRLEIQEKRFEKITKVDISYPSRFPLRPTRTRCPPSPTAQRTSRNTTLYFRYQLRKRPGSNQIQGYKNKSMNIFQSLFISRNPPNVRFLEDEWISKVKMDHVLCWKFKVSEIEVFVVGDKNVSTIHTVEVF